MVRLERLRVRRRRVQSQAWVDDRSDDQNSTSRFGPHDSIRSDPPFAPRPSTCRVTYKI
jgi:hypothetical protein